MVNLKTLLRTYERELIVSALNACGWHQRRTAGLLGVRPTTLNEKMKRLGIPSRPVPAERPLPELVGAAESASFRRA